MTETTHDMTATQTITRLTISNDLLHCADGSVAYRTSGLYFTVEPSDVFDIHEAPIEVGPHPYASVSLARRAVSVPPSVDCWPVATVADLDQKHALEDWMQWCDDVAAALVGDDNDDEPACVPPWTTQATINAVMYSTGAVECTEVTAVRVAQVNAMV